MKEILKSLAHGFPNPRLKPSPTLYNSGHMVLQKPDKMPPETPKGPTIKSVIKEDTEEDEGDAV